MTTKYFKPFFLLLSFAFVLACSSDATKNNTTTDQASRPTVPITRGEVPIGTQVWMTKNLNVSRYRNGDPIPQVTNATQWSSLTTGAWCNYANITANGTTYGKLYNWYAVNDPRGLAPVGYHVPSDAEWTILTTFLGGETVAGGKMKATTEWIGSNTGATNSSGFTALPGGFCANGNGTFNSIGSSGYWWSSSESGSTSARARNLSSSFGYVDRINTTKTNGFSVRCLRD